MKKFFASICAATILLFTPTADAEIQTYEGNGEYLMSDFEAMPVAKERAKNRAEEDALDQAGVYVTSFSKLNAAKLTADEITAVTNTITEIVGDVNYSEKLFQLTEQSTATIVAAKLTAKVDTDVITNFLKLNEKDRVKIVEDSNRLKKAADDNDKQVENLKRRYKETDSQAERDKIKTEINSLDKEFLAIQKLREANKSYFNRDFRAAIDLYSQSIELNPTFTAYNNRAGTYAVLNRYDDAFADFKKAIALKPNDSMIYNNRAAMYKDMKNFDAALADFNKAIELNPIPSTLTKAALFATNVWATKKKCAPTLPKSKNSPPSSEPLREVLT